MVDGNLNINGAQTGLMSALERGVADAVQHLLQTARAITPIEEGTLERGSTATTAREGDAILGAVAFHGPYAARQHEELTWRHDPGRQAKYLEDPMHQEADTMGRIIAQAAKGSL